MPLFILALPVMYYHSAYQYKIKILGLEVEQWEGWCLKYDHLEEIQKEYPEFLPHVCPEDSRLTVDPDPNDWSVYWEDGDGVWSFYEIYEGKRLINFLDSPHTSAEMPKPYLTLDRDCFLHHNLGRGLQKGIYYINQIKGRKDRYEKKYYHIGSFVEIGEEGWRIAGYDIPDSDIIPMAGEQEQAPMHSENYISPVLSFGQRYKIKKRNNTGFRQRPEFMIRVLKDDSWAGMIADPRESYDEEL